MLPKTRRFSLEHKPDQEGPTSAVNPNSERASVASVQKCEIIQRLVEHERSIHAYIFSLVPEWNAAEEILQETYLRLFQRIEQAADEDELHSSGLFAWACACAHFQVMSYRTRARRDRLHFSHEFVEQLAALQRVESEELTLRLDALEKCIGQLSETNRGLLRLAYRGDLRVEEVAERVERTVLATYQALSRLRKALKQCVERAVRNLK